MYNELENVFVTLLCVCIDREGGGGGGDCVAH